MCRRIGDVPVLVIGATMAAFGIAYKLREKALVVERTALIGHEFVNSYNPGEEWNLSLVFSESVDFKKELKARNLLTEDGKVHIPALSPVIFNRIKKEKFNFLFMTEVVEITKMINGYKVTLYNNSGYQTINVKMIIDTTSAVASYSGKIESINSKSINAMLHPSTINAEFPQAKENHVTFVQGRFPSEVIMSFKLEKEDSWIVAREKLHRYWINRDESIRDWTMAATAATFAIQCEKGPVLLDDYWVWLPSCAYRNPLESMEAGLAFKVFDGMVAC